MTILYQSTRGQAPELDLRGVTMAGLAPDGGLYVPKTWPQFSLAEQMAMQSGSYLQTAMQVLSPFFNSTIPQMDLQDLLGKSYASFSDPALTPLRQLKDGLWILELFHGPTLAFKDVALQLLGHVFEYFLKQSGERMTVVGATSGDTGSAAMSALAGRKNIDVFILYPNKGPSDIQRKQMTCMEASNLHAIAIDGSFDDCQAIVKAMFNDTAVRQRFNLSAVNSINWLRILAQMVYYFVACAKVGKGEQVSFAVPTGNFGNIFAAYAAKQCGAPIANLAVASNRNDILTRFFASGIMKPEGVHATLSPSMDIQISSNFERLLFDVCDRDGAHIRRLMNDMKSKGEFVLDAQHMAKAKQVFRAARCDDALTIKTIQDVYNESGYVLDPHSAVGVSVARQLGAGLQQPMISLACAHPAKFPNVIEKAIGIKPQLPDTVATLLQKPERMHHLPAQTDAVTQFIAERINL